MTGKDLKLLYESKFLTPSKAADLLGISRQTLYNWVASENLTDQQVSHINSKFSLQIPDNDLQITSTLVQEPNSIYESSIKQIPFTDFMETEYLPIEAQAGYLDCLETQEIPKLDTMLIPKEFEKGNYLVVEIKGDSMNDGSARSIQDGDKLLVKELIREHWKNKLHYNQYIFVIASHDGIVCKQITSHEVHNGNVNCHSWNPMYKDYVISLENVYKLFYVKKIVDRRIKF